jgi:hypothetical protein
LIISLKTIYNELNISFVYISEAHATDVWPIGRSAGVLNKKHHTIEDRQRCANNFIKEYEFTEIPTYLDNMKNELRDTLAAWPFRFYLIKYNKDSNFVFHHIGMPEDSEFDLTNIGSLL